jgi:hypothetical protein
MDVLRSCTDRSPWVPAFAGMTELLLHRDKDVPRCRRSRHTFSCRRFRESEEYANLRNQVLVGASALKQLKPSRAVGDIVQKHWAPRFAFIPAVVAIEGETDMITGYLTDPRKTRELKMWDLDEVGARLRAKLGIVLGVAFGVGFFLGGVATFGLL